VSGDESWSSESSKGCPIPRVAHWAYAQEKRGEEEDGNWKRSERSADRIAEGDDANVADLEAREGAAQHGKRAQGHVARAALRH